MTLYRYGNPRFVRMLTTAGVLDLLEKYRDRRHESRFMEWAYNDLSRFIEANLDSIAREV